MNLSNQMHKLKLLSDYFSSIKIEDIYTNSKIYEVLIAYTFDHIIINGHANTPDACDQFNRFYEYKHFKTSSSNHTWTFNDFSDGGIQKLNKIDYVFFSIIDDSHIIPKIIKTYIVSGNDVSRYLKEATTKIKNKRKMINISVNQVCKNMNYSIMEFCKDLNWNELKEVFITANKIEELINVKGILTSNKLWELLVACELGHNINSDQKKHDAYDSFGHTYEYKVSSNYHWSFQDISDNVLESYLLDESIILAIINKKEFIVKKLYSCKPDAIVSLLTKKLAKKEREMRRFSASVGMKDIRDMINLGDAICVH